MKKALFSSILLGLTLSLVLAAACGDDDDDNNDDSTADDDESVADDDDTDDDLPHAEVQIIDPPDGNPLARNLVVTTDVSCSLSGYVTAASETGYGPASPTATAEGTSHNFWFYGLLENTTFEYTFYLAGQPEKVVATGSFKTSVLQEKPEIESLTILDFEGETDWYAIWMIDAINWEGVEANLTMLYDRQGRVRFLHENEGEDAGWIEVLENGDIAYATNDVVIGVQPDGTEYTLIDVQPNDPYYIKRHHQFYLPGLTSDYSLVLYNQAGDGVQCDLTTPTDKMLGDGVLLLDAQGRETWRWNIFDHQDVLPQTAMDPSNCLLHYWGPAYIDWAHLNTVIPVPDDDNALLISSRNLLRIFKIDRTTGEVLWQMGPDLDFQWLGSPGEIEADYWFRMSHDIQYLSPTRLLMFDNGVCRYQPVCVLGTWSRALEIEIDETNKTVQLAWEHRVPFSASQGNVQRHENGNTLIGTGGSSRAIEVTSADQEIFNLKYPWGNVRAKYYPAFWSNEEPPGK